MPLKVIVSGGGTGGHIFPAIAIADAVKQLRPDAEILFVGAEGRMEMEKVPAAGYKIEGLKIAGLQRRLTLKNLSFPFKLAGSLLKARSIVNRFKPDVAVGVGGYASGPLLRAAGWKGVPSLIQEQNSFPGITNRLLAKSARKICVAYEGMEKYFPSNKLILTGNPVRSGIDQLEGLRNEALEHFELGKDRTTVLVIGGSLGARTINQSLMGMISELESREDIQVLWQTGKSYLAEAEKAVVQSKAHLKVLPFISKMDLAYAAADIIVSRAGAMSISELCLVGKPAILVPSPNVAEDHQTKNAMALVNKNAAVLVKDKDCVNELLPTILELHEDRARQEQLSSEIRKLAKPNAAREIAEQVIALANK